MIKRDNDEVNDEEEEDYMENEEIVEEDASKVDLDMNMNEEGEGLIESKSNTGSSKTYDSFKSILLVRIASVSSFVSAKKKKYPTINMCFMQNFWIIQIP